MNEMKFYTTERTNIESVRKRYKNETDRKASNRQTIRHNGRQTKRLTELSKQESSAGTILAWCTIGRQFEPREG